MATDAMAVLSITNCAGKPVDDCEGVCEGVCAALTDCVGVGDGVVAWEALCEAVVDGVAVGVIDSDAAHAIFIAKALMPR
jgi:hypothetical protein